MKKKGPKEAGSDDREAASGALARGLTILHEMLAAPQPLTLSEIAALAKLDQSTTLRLLRTLESTRHVLRLDDSKRYAPSPSAIYPLPLLHPLEQVRRETQPLLERLARSLGETVVLILYVGLRRMVVDIAHSPNSLSPFYSRRLEGPLHATSSGKMLLAGLKEADRKAALGAEPYSAETARTITDFATLNADIELAAGRGYAVARDEQLLGLTAVAANIADQEQRTMGCLCVTGHTRDFDDDRIATCGEELLTTAKLIAYQATSLRNAAHFLGRG